MLVSQRVRCPRSKMYGDNNASMSVSSGQNTWRTRALTNKSAAITSRIVSGTLELEYIATNEMLADGLTNFLSVPLTNKLRKDFGLLMT